MRTEPLKSLRERERDGKGGRKKERKKERKVFRVRLFLYLVAFPTLLFPPTEIYEPNIFTTDAFSSAFVGTGMISTVAAANEGATLGPAAGGAANNGTQTVRAAKAREMFKVRLTVAAAKEGCSTRLCLRGFLPPLFCCHPGCVLVCT